MKRGVLEPLQTASTVAGQVDELVQTLTEHAHLPVTLVGHSWGAWLVAMGAAQWPALVSKLILVGSGPFEARYAAEIMPERLRRLSDADRVEVEELFVRLTDDPGADDGAFARLGVLLGSADAFDPLPRVDVPGETQPEIYASVWPEAAELRRSGRLLDLASKISCPVLAIHGAYDPHPAAGVRDPLTRLLKDFRFVLLPECGHTPWLERRALDEFYHLLEDEF